MSEIDSTPSPSAWLPEELSANRNWQYGLTDAQIDELRISAASIPEGREWQDISAESYNLSSWSGLIADLRDQLEGGLGIGLIRSLPVDEVSPGVARAMLWGIGQHLGYPEKQDAAGNVLHDVVDTGKDLSSDNIRAYQTNLPIHYHNDGSDALLLLCYRQARSGGRSQLISAVSVYNAIQERRPDLAAILRKPFHFDARGQQIPGQPPYQTVPIFTEHKGHLNVLYKRQYIDLAQRFDEVPDLTSDQTEALDLMDEVCAELAFEFTMEPGDIIAANNYDILHARSEFEDGDSDEGRHMMRLWLSLPNGRPLPPVFEHTREFCHSYRRRHGQPQQDRTRQ